MNAAEKEVAGKLLVLVKEDGEIKGKPPTLHQAYREDALKVRPHHRQVQYMRTQIHFKNSHSKRELLNKEGHQGTLFKQGKCFLRPGQEET